MDCNKPPAMECILFDFYLVCCMVKDIILSWLWNFSSFFFQDLNIFTLLEFYIETLNLEIC